jgi:hypothetical protein
MNQQTRLRIALIIFGAAIVIGFFGMPYLLDWRSGKAFARIAQGDSETRVILYLGSPDAKGACGTQLRWEQESVGANDGRCVREVRYKGRRGSWVVGYSADGHVVSKYFDLVGQGGVAGPSGG